MSTYLQLLENRRVLDVKTNQILQQTLIMNASQVFLIFEDHCQLWDLDLNKQIYRGNVNEGQFFYTLPVQVNRTTIVTVRLEDCDPQLQTFNIETNEVKTLGGFPDEQQNFLKLFYFPETGKFVVTSKGKQTRLYTYDPQVHLQYTKELPHIKYDENWIFDQYDNRGVIASYSGAGNTTQFNLIKEDGSFSSYNLKGDVEQGAIRLVKQYSATEAVVALLHNNEKTSTVVQFNLESGETMKKTSLTFPFDNVFKTNDVWIAIATLGDDEQSNVKVQPVFSQQNNEPIRRNLGRGIRIWNDIMPIMTVNYDHRETDEKEKQIITRVMCASKRSIYINFLQKAGLIEAFGNEIIKEVINNFN